MTKLRMKKWLSGALVCLSGISIAGLAHAQSWPTKPIKLIVPYPPGGGTDVIARIVQEPLAKELGQQVIIDNRGGAGGNIGADAVAKSVPDGYTLLVSHASVHVFSAATMPTLPFNPVTDFTHIGLLVEAPNVLLVKSESRFKTLADYLDAAKTQPVRFGSSGIGSAPHLLGAMLSGEAKVTNLDHVPYRGSAPAMQDLMANQIESLIDPITTNVQLMKDGVLRALAVSSPQRLPAFPNVPTFAELGFPKLTSAQWLGLSGPKGMPQPIVDRLAGLINPILARPELMARFEELQTLPRRPAPMNGDFVKIMREQITEWTAVAKQFDIVVT